MVVLVGALDTQNSGDGSLGYCLCKALATTSLDSALKLWLGTKGNGLRIELLVFVGQDSRRFLLTHASHTFCRMINLGDPWRLMGSSNPHLLYSVGVPELTQSLPRSYFSFEIQLLNIVIWLCVKQRPFQDAAGPTDPHLSSVKA